MKDRKAAKAKYVTQATLTVGEDSPADVGEWEAGNEKVFRISSAAYCRNRAETKMSRVSNLAGQNVRAVLPLL